MFEPLTRVFAAEGDEAEEPGPPTLRARNAHRGHGAEALEDVQELLFGDALGQAANVHSRAQAVRRLGGRRRKLGGREGAGSGELRILMPDVRLSSNQTAPLFPHEESLAQKTPHALLADEAHQSVSAFIFVKRELRPLDRLVVFFVSRR